MLDRLLDLAAGGIHQLLEIQQVTLASSRSSQPSD
jgi:hypothetical protein